MTRTVDRPFELIGDLPPARLAIQASAGTGKTYTLAALAARFIAERDVMASELLVVTFTRAATSELRSRIRDRLVEAATHLRSVLEGWSSSSPVDELLEHLAAADVEMRLDRLERAVVEFDAASITTIHGFASQVLGTLGTTSGTDLDAKLVDDIVEQATGACTDVLARASTQGHRAEALPTFNALYKATRVALNTPDLGITPQVGQPGATDQQVMLGELVQAAMALMGSRRRDAGLLSFDDILLELRRALDGPGRAAALDAIRTRFRVVLIDEFQDTDPVQWHIFSTLFGDAVAGGTESGGTGSGGTESGGTGSGGTGRGDTTLVLVGDPKQAIYAFRGANVHTYLSAVADGSGTVRRSLGTNFRSDAAVIESLDVLFDGATFGDDRIAFAPVQAAPAHRSRRLRTATGEVLPALSIRLALDAGLTRIKSGEIGVDPAERAIYADLAERVRELLETAVIPDPEAQDEGAAPTVAVRPSHVAVLVRTGTEATAVQRALLGHGIPAVLARGGSVLRSPAAEQWRWLLEALVRPSDPARARTFALSWFAGRSANWIDGASDDALGELQDQLHQWSDTLLSHGVVEFVRRVWSDSGVVARVLARSDGDRAVTDLDHIGELLQTAAPNGRASVAGLLSALESDPIPEIDEELDDDVAARRIESEAHAVKIMTVWVAKGLQFPIVCCPTLWRQKSGPTIYEDPDTGRRTFDVVIPTESKWPDKAGAADRLRLAEQERDGENLRLLYVALTRAQHHTIVWWTRARGANTSALARVLFARDGSRLDPGQFHAPKVALPDDGDALDTLGPLIERAGGTMVAEVHGRPPRPAGTWSDPAAGTPTAALVRAELDRVPDRSLHRWSFTAITSRASRSGDPFDTTLGDGGADDELAPADDGDLPDRAGDRADGASPSDGSGRAGSSEPEPTALTLFPELHDPPPGPSASPAPPSPLAMLPAGAEFGTFVHSLLEEVDFATDHLDDELRTRIDRQLRRRAIDLTPVGVGHATADDGRRLVVAGLRAAIETPLGPIADGRRLRDLGRADRLDEMSFELRLGQAGTRPTDRDIGRLVSEHLEVGDRLRPWATALAAGAFDVQLAGHLTGSIDAVLRVPGRDGRPRFVVVDYKTNRLTPRGVTPAPDDYSAVAMTIAMAEHHYPLQALLYAVALHRYLRWRLPAYDPRVHLGGAAYLFLRGMTGARARTGTGQAHGVFSWPIPPALVIELSDLLDGRPVVPS